MGATKKENFSTEIVQQAELFKVLGNPARLQAIVMILAKKQDDDLTLEELRQATGLATSTLSYHLKKLKEMACLQTKVKTENKKLQVGYRLEPRIIPKIKNIFAVFLKADEKIHQLIEREKTTKYHSNFLDIFPNESVGVQT